MKILQLTIDLSTMAHIMNEDLLAPLIDSIHDTIVSNSEAVQLLSALQLQRLSWKRIFR